MAADYPTMTTAEIRSAYLNFFEKIGRASCRERV